uniref:Uncharacterized protein n=1 Tax=Cacopsylla melanoneura TaxID=428564 RepID=A0A8D8X8B3_9HEMI
MQTLSKLFILTHGSWGRRRKWVMRIFASMEAACSPVVPRRDAQFVVPVVPTSWGHVSSPPLFLSEGAVIKGTLVRYPALGGWGMVWSAWESTHLLEPKGHSV